MRRYIYYTRYNNLSLARALPPTQTHIHIHIYIHVHTHTHAHTHTQHTHTHTHNIHITAKTLAQVFTLRDEGLDVSQIEITVRGKELVVRQRSIGMPLQSLKKSLQKSLKEPPPSIEP